MQRRAIAIAVAAAIVAAACSITEAPHPSGAGTIAPATATPGGPSKTAASPSPVGGGCGATQVYAGPGPDAAIGLADNPWAPATPSDAGIVAYFWQPPPDLVFASSPGAGGTKVLWVIHGPAAGDLTIAAHPSAATSPIVTSSFPAADSPAVNYPSRVELPSAGCWHLDLTIGAAHATMELLVAAAPTPIP